MQYNNDTSQQQQENEKNKEKREQREDNAIKYKNTMINGIKSPPKTSLNTDKVDVEKMINSEIKNNKNLSWTRLNRNEKLNKLRQFAETYCKTNSLHNTSELQDYFLKSIQRNKFQKSTDVKYDKSKQIITAVPNLIYVSDTNRFTLSRGENKVSTLASLSNTKYTRKKKK